MKYCIKTFGCQMNVSDSERIAGFLESHKFKPAKNINEADLLIFNTCGVRQSAEDRVYGQIHNLRSKNKDLGFKIILTGCLAKRSDVIKRLKSKVDLFTGIKDFQKNTLESKILKLKSPQVRCPADYFKIKPKYSTNFSAYVPIMTGCDNFCTYCVVPYARGREFSRPYKEIISEVKNLIKKKYKEITLLGQNVNSYHAGKVNFPKLLRMINKVPGNFWLRFLTSHPKDMTDELIETIARCKKVCEYVHLPIQAGDDEILRKMNRKYTTKHYLGLIKKIKNAFKKYKPGALYTITSDIIVGFPGETKKQFSRSAEIMKEVGYDMVYFGQYSPRPGTAAWKMKDNVSKKEKEQREKYLNEILKKNSFENNKRCAGKILDVLVDSQKIANKEQIESKSERIFYLGKTRTMKNVKFESRKKNLVGKFVKVKITKANIWNLEGKLS